MMVELQRKKRPAWGGYRVMDLTRSLPFFRCRQGQYIHRVRSGWVHVTDKGKPRHTSLSAWCGISGHVGNSAKPDEILNEPPIGFPICATCEGRAIGAGQTESRMICGRIVKFSPRQ